jgi:hypothetical protein
MKTVYIILQFGTSMTGSLSVQQLVLLWGSIILFISLFIFFLVRTDKIISKKNHSSEHLSKNKSEGKQVTDEEAAAIALAINMYKRDLHDMESLTITLKKVSRIYSPWSSKIYTLRQNPKF